MKNYEEDLDKSIHMDVDETGQGFTLTMYYAEGCKRKPHTVVIHFLTREGLENYLAVLSGETDRVIEEVVGLSSVTMTQDELDELLEQHPDLSSLGCRTSEQTEERFDRDRQELRSRLSEVNASLEFLSKCSRTAVTKGGRSSYGLKHCAERLCESRYVCNGALIAAAIHLDLPYEREGPNSPSIIVGIEVPTHV